MAYCFSVLISMLSLLSERLGSLLLCSFFEILLTFMGHCIGGGVWVVLQIWAFGPLFFCGGRRGSIHVSWENKAQKETGFSESSWKPVTKSKFNAGLLSVCQVPQS